MPDAMFTDILVKESNNAHIMSLGKYFWKISPSKTTRTVKWRHIKGMCFWSIGYGTDTVKLLFCLVVSLVMCPALCSVFTAGSQGERTALISHDEKLITMALVWIHLAYSERCIVSHSMLLLWSLFHLRA